MTACWLRNCTNFNPESDSAEHRAIARSTEDRMRREHFLLIGAAIFGTDDVERPTARLETFFRLSGVPDHQSMYTIVCHLMNPQTGWLRWYRAFKLRNWSVAPYKEYIRNRDRLFQLAVQMSKTNGLTQIYSIS